MFGQCGYFRNYARGTDEELRHGRDRYGNETARIYRVLEQRLSTSPYIAGVDYSIADMATYPWIQPYMHGTDLAEYPNIQRWFDAVKGRPAVQRAYALLAEDCKIGDKSDETHANLFEKQQSVGVREQGRAKDDEDGPTVATAAAASVASSAMGERDGPGAADQRRDVPDIELWYVSGVRSLGWLVCVCARARARMRVCVCACMCVCARARVKTETSCVIMPISHDLTSS